MPKPTEGVLYIRGVSSDLSLRLKAAAALQGYPSLNAYLLDHLKEHVTELERKGVLPKPKT